MDGKFLDPSEETIAGMKRRSCTMNPPALDQRRCNGAKGSPPWPGRLSQRPFTLRRMRPCLSQELSTNFTFRIFGGQGSQFECWGKNDDVVLHATSVATVMNTSAPKDIGETPVSQT
jgi:hypothetical protein